MRVRVRLGGVSGWPWKFFGGMGVQVFLYGFLYDWFCKLYEDFKGLLFIGKKAKRSRQQDGMH